MAELNQKLLQLAETFDTPVYAYDTECINERFRQLDQLFGSHFDVSYAVKANPNVALLRTMLPHIATFDVSSLAELERALAAGCPVERITFSGPGKRTTEIRSAVSLDIGELVLESLVEANTANEAALNLGCVQNVLLRINPLKVPRHFGVNMAGKGSQFGVDEECMEEAINAIMALPGLNLIGFHLYSGTNSLSHEAIRENFEIFIDIFRRATACAGIAPQKLVFGSGFGLPYIEGDQPLDVEALSAQVRPLIEALKAEANFSRAVCVLEMGRWIVGPAGWLLTSVIAAKESRGVSLRICDAGFNNHLAACGMMGSVIRRNWRFANLSNPDGVIGQYTLVGPLCTTIDILASNLELSETNTGDVLSIEFSGAYGLTASPTRFISHPEPREVLIEGESFRDVTESSLNHWHSAKKNSASEDTVGGSV